MEEPVNTLALIYLSSIHKSFSTHILYLIYYKAGASARELIVRERHKKPVITFCREVDSMLGGGVPRGELTEVCRLCLDTKKACMNLGFWAVVLQR